MNLGTPCPEFQKVGGQIEYVVTSKVPGDGAAAPLTYMLRILLTRTNQ